MPYGLKDDVLHRITEVFATYPQVDQVILYGSRAKGNFRPGSDIDLTMVGNGMTTKEMNRIANILDDLLLPYEIDLSIYHHIDNKDLLNHIQRVGKTIYKK